MSISKGGFQPPKPNSRSALDMKPRIDNLEVGVLVVQSGNVCWCHLEHVSEITTVHVLTIFQFYYKGK